ncbi:DUF2125 domain containing protein [Sulfitobacter noctilucicola]|uniref:DUF2125 domain-containing protein n=1 Tax=Sulfitobacter noctilucicola TaxID=1342301 RepID=A0A7W6M6R0_9RHOB|nr:DUF2125 domain-containing protein [Sulfitobacter noctilucicola]KIN62070.1 DUF2125 domain containing protein [Sulfitobacter noctilucicola]MBB4173411.1 hypothetical protein [Sulfitobacter noctilucicola]
MRRLIWVTGVFALIWTGAWFAAAFLIRESLENTESVAVEAVEVSGFPLALNIRMDSPRFAAPSGQINLDTQELTITSPAWWPLNATLRLPSDMLRVTHTGQRFELLTMNASVGSKIRPTAALELSSVALQSGEWTLNGFEQRLVGGAAIGFALQQVDQRPTQYDWVGNLDALSLGPTLRALINVPADWPSALSAMAAQGTIRFEEPLSRHHLDGPPPKPRALVIEKAQAVWGSSEVELEGKIEIDARGVPEGDLSLFVKNWRALYLMIPVPLPVQAEIMLNALANIGGNPETMDLTLSFRDGVAFLGPIALGPVPPLVMR